jgi:hypothetical protein
MEDFIREGIARADKELEELPILNFTDVRWFLDVDYEEGIPAYLTGYSFDKDQFFRLELDPENPDDPYIIYGYVEGDWLEGLEW